MYRVFRLPKAHASKIDVLWKDDIVSRQSVTPRLASSLGLPGEDTLVLVEGCEPAVERATELLKGAGSPLPSKEAEDAYRRFQSQEEDAASGMGLIFGP